MSKRSRIKALFSVLMVLTVAFFAISLPGCQPKGEIKIGVITSITGTIGPYGESVLQGIQLATDEINEAGGIKGRAIKLIVEDAESEPQGAVAAANKLIEVDQVLVIIGPVASSNVMAVAPIANEKKVVILSPAGASPNITDAGDYVFRNRAAGGLEAMKLAEYAVEKLDAQKASLLYINTDYGVAYKEIIVKEFSAAGGEIGIVEPFDQGTTDFRAQLTKVKSDSPDVVFLLGNPKEVGLILRQAKETGIDAPFLANNVEGEELLNTAGDAAEGLVIVLPEFDVESSDERVRDFVTNHENRFGRKPDLYAANGYDAVYLVKNAIENGAKDPEGIKDQLYQTQGFQGVNGILSFDNNGDVVKPLTFKKVVDGAFAKID